MKTPNDSSPQLLTEQPSEAGCVQRACSGFFIVNTTDRPSEDHLAERRADGKFYYVHPRLKNIKAHWGMTPHAPTPIEAFGLRVMLLHGMLYGESDPQLEKTAAYSDGRPRKWQGARSFEFRFQNAKGELPTERK